MDLADYRLKLTIFHQLKHMGVNVARSKSEEKAHRKGSKQAEMEQDDNHTIFGARLVNLTSSSGVDIDGLVVPRFMAEINTELRKHLATTGLFRIPGNSQRMNAIRKDLDTGKRLPTDAQANDYASLLKAFFRELKEPLFTFGFFNGFVRAYRLSDPELRRRAVLMLCCLLEEEHLHTLVLLMKLLHAVSEHSENQMEPAALASILTPNLLRPREQAAVTSQLELQTHASCCGVVEMLIVHADEIGSVPTDVIKAATELPDEPRAKKNYLKLLAGRRIGWFSRIRVRLTRDITKSSGAVSVNTLNMLKRSEKEATSASPMSPRARAMSTNPAGAYAPVMAKHGHGSGTMAAPTPLS